MTMCSTGFYTASMTCTSVALLGMISIFALITTHLPQFQWLGAHLLPSFQSLERFTLTHAISMRTSQHRQHPH